MKKSEKLLAKIAVTLLVIFIACALILGAADIEKEWGTTVEMHETTTYGGDGATVTAATYTYGANTVNLQGTGEEGTQITLTYNNGGTTDYFVFSIFASRDGTNWDTEEYWSITCPLNGGAETRMTFIVRDLMYFRVGAKLLADTGDTYEWEAIADPWHWEYE
jgi:hypothetical protein